MPWRLRFGGEIHRLIPRLTYGDIGKMGKYQLLR